jgi:hypothetical protein
MLLDIYWSFRTTLFSCMVGNDTFAHVINAIVSNFNLILVSSNTHKRSQYMQVIFFVQTPAINWLSSQWNICYILRNITKDLLCNRCDSIVTSTTD